VTSGIVQRHKGKIWVRSRAKGISATGVPEARTGTVFSLFLPMDGMR
jgi:signal transduction histidine kinase